MQKSLIDNFGGYHKLIESLPEVTSLVEALQDYNGEQNTTEIITALTGYNDGYTTGAPAAEACRARTFNGKQGFLPTLGQFHDFYQHRLEVDQLVTKFFLDVFSMDLFYWTSTQCSAAESWDLYWINGYMDFNVRYVRRLFRAFFAL